MFLKSRRAFSLIEVIIGLAILFVVITFIVYAIQGNRNESRRSGKYFNGVFLAQKIIDDIDNRCRENIYTIELLSKYDGKVFKIVDGKSPIFKYLEDTNSDGKVNDDAPIKKDAGSIYNQFKDYSYKLEFDRKFGNGLSKLKVTIMWDDKGKKHKYIASQILQDLPFRVESDIGELSDIEIGDNVVNDYLFEESDDLNTNLEKYHISYPLAYNLAKVQYIVRLMSKSIMEFEKKIKKIKNSRYGSTPDGIIEIAKIHEEIAVKIVQGYNVLAIPFNKLSKLDNDFLKARIPFTKKIKVLIEDFSVLTKTLKGKINKNCLAIRFNTELASAMNNYIQLLVDKNYSSKLSYKKKIGALTKVINIGSALVQNNSENMIFSMGNSNITLKQLVKNSFNMIIQMVSGKDYNREFYVSQKMKTIESGKFREFEDISERLANMDAISSLTLATMKKIRVSIKLYLADKLKKSKEDKKKKNNGK